MQRGRKMKGQEPFRAHQPGIKRCISCPKCGATRSLHRYAAASQNGSASDGLSCLMCGYWLDTTGEEQRGVLSRDRI